MASTPTTVLSGVPQGTVLGPLFFLIYINDISKGLSQGTKIRLFADDSLLYRTIKTPLDSAALQKDLDTLQLWEKKWKMEFHPGKCQLLRITNKINPLKSDYKIHNTIISETDAAKYLGVFIDSKLNWKQQYTHIIKKSNIVLSFISRNLNKCPKSIKSKCFTTLVRPHLEYACAVWDPHFQTDIDSIDRVQKRAARFATNNYCFETGNSEKNRKSLEWDTLEERRLQTKLTTFHKARLKLLEIPTDHLKFKDRKTRHNGDGICYSRTFSTVDSHKFSFYQSTIALWNLLPAEIKLCEDADLFTSKIKSINLTSLKNQTCKYNFK